MDIINVLSTLILGLYAGSLLTEGMILVPFWRKMDPKEFFRLHGSMGPNLFNYFAPLTVLAVGLAVLTAIANRGQNIAFNISACLALSALAIFFIYFRKANKSFADHSLNEDQLPGELLRWARWHWLRTVLIIVASAVSIIGFL